MDERSEQVSVPRAEWEALKAQVAELAQIVHGEVKPSPATGEDLSDRRSLLKRGAVLAAGAMAGGTAMALGAAQRASAADGDAIIMGQQTLGSAPTIAASPGINTSAFTFTDDTAYVPGVPAIGTPAPVLSVVSTTGRDGVFAEGSTALFGSGSTYGLYAQGALAAALLRTAPDSSGMPQNDTRAHLAGELYVETVAGGSVLWFCVASGTPGDWTQLAAPNSGSSFTPNVPERLYDSRTADGPLDGGQTRVVSLGIPGGVGSLPNLSRVLNLTITNTVGAGYLQLYSNAIARPATSTINWWAPGQIAANMTITQVDTEGRVAVTAGGGSTQFVIDGLGWFN